MSAKEVLDQEIGQELVFRIEEEKKPEELKPEGFDCSGCSGGTGCQGGEGSCGGGESCGQSGCSFPG